LLTSPFWSFSLKNSEPNFQKTTCPPVWGSDLRFTKTLQSFGFRRQKNSIWAPAKLCTSIQPGQNWANLKSPRYCKNNARLHGCLHHQWRLSLIRPSRLLVNWNLVKLSLTSLSTGPGFFINRPRFLDPGNPVLSIRNGPPLSKRDGVISDLWKRRNRIFEKIRGLAACANVSSQT